MSKLDELRRGAAGNAAESMGARDQRPGAAGPIGPARSTVEQRPAANARYQGLERLRGANEIPVDRLTRDPSQPREIFDEAALQELVESIESLGVLQPVRVRFDEELGMYVIIAGERRFRAARMAGLKSVPCVVQEGELTESQRLIEQLAENIIRADLQPIEQARAFRRLMDLNGWSARQLAREMHIADASIVRALALLELPDGVRDQVEAGKLAPSVAYEVSRLEGADEQAAMADRIVAERLTRDQVADAVKARKQGRGAPSASARVEFKLEAGRKVTVAGLPDDNPETVLAALAEATKQARRRAREGTGERAA